MKPWKGVYPNEQELAEHQAERRRHDYKMIVVLVLVAVVGAAVEPAITHWRESLSSLQQAGLYFGGFVGFIVALTAAMRRWG